MYIEEIRKTNKCTGCGNCKNRCPAKAIEMIEDEEGFRVPSVDYEKCLNCRICELKCPLSMVKYADMELLPKAVLVRNREKERLQQVASGGICFTLSDYFVRVLHGFVCGAVFDEDYSVKHIVTNSMDDIIRMSQSKYVQSDLGKCFSSIENLLRNGQFVLFVGTTCQVYALKKYLDTSYDRLFCIDLICHGVPSPKVQREYVAYLRKHYGNLRRLSNRNKRFYQHSYVNTYASEFEGGHTIVKRYSDDPMAIAFFKHLSIRQTCYSCEFKSLHRISDLTVGDFWFSEQYGMGEDKYGINLCLVQGKKGDELLAFVNDCVESCHIDSEEAIVLNGGMLYASCEPHKNRETFFEKLGKVPFDKLVNQCAMIGRKERVKNFVRELVAPILRKTHYYNRQLVKSANNRRKRVIPENRKGKLFY